MAKQKKKAAKTKAHKKVRVPAGGHIVEKSGQKFYCWTKRAPFGRGQPTHPCTRIAKGVIGVDPKGKLLYATPPPPECKDGDKSSVKVAWNNRIFSCKGKGAKLTCHVTKHKAKPFYTPEQRERMERHEAYAPYMEGLGRYGRYGRYSRRRRRSR